MTVAARRLWLYGLCLLLPALTVGGLALGLLARERSRLAEREQVARESRRAAVESRARTIAENIELLVGDVQSALMATLLEAPEAEPRTFLTDWQANNPLVRDVFRATVEGRVVWGATGDPLRGWLGKGSPWDELQPAATAATGVSVASTPAPATQSADPVVLSIKGGAEEAAEGRQLVGDYYNGQAQQARKEISNNINSYRSARQAIQEVAKLKNSADNGLNSFNSNSSSEQILGAISAAPPPASPSVRVDANSAESAGQVLGQAFDAVAREQFTDGQANRPTVQSLSQANAPMEPRAEQRLTRSGWTPWRDAGGLHLFGWRELSDRTVIGLELRLDAIKARLGEVFPSAPEPGEAYALRDAGGVAWHQVGSEDLPVALEVPLAAETLPGWTVVARMRADEYGASAPNGFFIFGAALIALLVLAILAAGALLVRQARLSELEAARKTSFVANVSHELKTPLTTIRLYAELLAEGRVRDEARRADYLETIGRETQRLGRLVANVLDFSRLEQGKKKYAPAPLDLAEDLRRLAETHGPRMAAAGLALRVEAPGSLRLATDRDAVEQIVLNLLDNACKYAAEGGEVSLRLRSEALDSGAVARLVVADRGPGVPEAQRERIFEKFHRVDDRLTAEKAGVGLGLSIARQLARGLGGDLRCEAAEGGGAAFVLTLPLSRSIP